jgi:hypothetical protein
MRHLWLGWLLSALFCAFTCQAADLQPGLVGEYFELKTEVEDFPRLPADAAPTLRRVEKTIQFKPVEAEFYETKLSDQFYARWWGVIRIEKAGSYAFYTNSDDGSRLFIRDALVVNNQGLHGMEEEEGSIDLEAGDHPVLIEYIEGSGAAGCIVSWAPAGREKEPLPERILFHDPAGKAPQPKAAQDPSTDLPPGFAAMKLEDKVALLLPAEEENRWMSIPWRFNLMQTRMESQVLGKPMFLWIMNGNPAACT